MGDPLSVAAGVAGLVALGGSVSKLFYNFFHSLIDAPSNVRELSTSLFTLNVVLSQVPEVLLNPDFALQAQDRDAISLNECLTRCTALLDGIQQKVEKSELSDKSANTVKRTWAAVKWWFTDEDVAQTLRLVADEKSTLHIALGAFTARMTAGIMGRVEQLQAEAQKTAQKQNRMLQDIYVCCKWQLAQVMDHGGVVQAPREEYSGFTASRAYERRDLRRLIESPGSVLSLKIGGLLEDSVSAVWTPDTPSWLPQRRVQSVLQRSQPSFDDFSSMQSLENEPILHQDVLGAVAKVYAVVEKSRRRKTERFLSAMMQDLPFGVGVMSQTPPLSGLPWTTLQLLLRSTAHSTEDIAEDLKGMGYELHNMEMIAQDIENDEELDQLQSAVYKAVTAYTQFAQAQYADNSDWHLLKAGKLIVRSLKERMLPEKRQQLRDNVTDAVKTFMTRSEIRSRSQLLHLQRRSSEMQRRQAEDHLLLMEKVDRLASRKDQGQVAVDSAEDLDIEQ